MGVKIPDLAKNFMHHTLCMYCILHPYLCRCTYNINKERFEEDEFPWTDYIHYNIYMNMFMYPANSHSNKHPIYNNVFVFL